MQYLHDSTTPYVLDTVASWYKDTHGKEIFGVRTMKLGTKHCILTAMVLSDEDNFLGHQCSCYQEELLYWQGPDKPHLSFLQLWAYQSQASGAQHQSSPLCSPLLLGRIAGFDRPKWWNCNHNHKLIDWFPHLLIQSGPAKIDNVNAELLLWSAWDD